jgi:hypothetical protein
MSLLEVIPFLWLIIVGIPYAGKIWNPLCAMLENCWEMLALWKSR